MCRTLTNVLSLYLPCTREDEYTVSIMNNSMNIVVFSLNVKGFSVGVIGDMEHGFAVIVRDADLL